MGFLLYLLIPVTLLWPLSSFARATHIEALQKALFIVLLSSMPVLISYLDKGFYPLRISELFIYAAAYLAPVIYWFCEDFPRKSKIRGSRFLMLYSALILVCTAAYFRSDSPDTANKANLPWIIQQYPQLPILVLAATLILWYFTIAYEKNSVDPSKEMRIEEQKFLSKVTKGRK